MLWMAEEKETVRNIAAVSGHSIDSTQKIIETYIPPTDAMTTSAVQSLDKRRHRIRRITDGPADQVGKIA